MAKLPTNKGHYSKGSVISPCTGETRERVYTTLSSAKALKVQQILKEEGIESTTESLWTTNFAGQAKEATMVTVEQKDTSIALLTLAERQLI
jgi:hypothetical protein